MIDRVVQFVRGLRAAGVRVSVAEAEDAMHAVEVLGTQDRSLFRHTLRATMVKAADDYPAFDALFDVYFGSGGPPLQNALEDLDEDEQAAVKAALGALAGRMQQLMDWLTSGQGPTREELEALAKRMGLERLANPRQARWVTSQMLRDLGFGRLEELLAQLMRTLQEAGLSDEAIAALLGVVEANREALAEQIGQFVGLTLAQQRAEQPPDMPGGELYERSLADLSPAEADEMRREVRRLVARLRSRAALRQKRAAAGQLDLRRTVRANLRYGGVPLELRRRTRRLKPRLVLVCDVSTSVRPVAGFLLHLIYELHDQVAHARSFAFNEDLEEVTHLLNRGNVEEAVNEVLYAIPPGYYATDLGQSLQTLVDTAPDSVDRRATVIILGDGRNNHRNPRLDLVKDIQRRSRRLVWLNPEPPATWGTGDSDMLAYAPLCDAVYPAANLAQLSAAVDRLLADR